MTYYGYRVGLSNGKIAKVWVAENEMVDEQIKSFLDQNQLSSINVINQQSAGFRNSDTRPQDKIGEAL